jgi:hypothetical protein
MSRERRKQSRYDLNLIVEIKSRTGTDNYHLGMTKNISADGFTFESQNYNILQGQVLEIDIKLRHSNLSVSALGKAVWVKVTEFECLTGITFVGLDEEARNRIVQLFSSAEPEPTIDMHHNYVPESYTSEIDNAISAAVSKAPNINVPVNDEPSIPEDLHIADNETIAPAVKETEQTTAAEPPEHSPVLSEHDLIREKETPVQAVRSRTPAEVSARKKRSYLPIGITAAVLVIAIALVFGIMIWKSKDSTPSSSQVALNETIPATIEESPSLIETPPLQDFTGVEQTESTPENKDIEHDQSVIEQPIVIAAVEQDNILDDPGLPLESVPIIETGKQSPELEQDKTVTVTNDGPPESSAASIAKTPALKKDVPTLKDAEAARKEIKSIPENNKPGKIIIPETNRRQAYLKYVRQRIQQEAKQTQKPSAVIEKAVKEKSVRSDTLTEPAPAHKLPETMTPFTDSTDIAKAIPPDKINIPGTDNSTADKPEPREIIIDTIDQTLNETVSEQVSSSPATPVKETIKDIPDKKKPLPTEVEKQVPALGSIALRVIPQKFDDNKTRAIISSSTAKTMKNYDEPFDNNTNSWDTFNTSSASAQIHNGVYIIENKREEGAHLILHQNDFPAASDFLMETSIRLLKSSATASFGLIFGAKNSFNNYSFQITTNRLYIVRNYHQGISMEMTMGKKGAANINIYGLNKLKIIRSGNNMSFYINDKLVDKITDLNLYGKRFGFIIDGQSKIAVEHMYSEIQVVNELQ